MKTPSIFVLLLTSLSLFGPAIAQGQTPPPGYEIRGTASARANKFAKKGKLITVGFSPQPFLDERIFYFPLEGRPVEFTGSAMGLTFFVKEEFPEGLTEDDAKRLLPELVLYSLGGSASRLVQQSAGMGISYLKNELKEKEVDLTRVSTFLEPSLKLDANAWSYSFCVLSYANKSIVAYQATGQLNPFVVNKVVTELIVGSSPPKR